MKTIKLLVAMLLVSSALVLTGCKSTSGSAELTGEQPTHPRSAEGIDSQSAD